MSKEDMSRLEDKIINTIPFAFDWCYYEGRMCVMAPDLEKSKACGRLIINIHPCMTAYHNGIIEKTVNWNPAKFKPHYKAYDVEKQIDP